MRLCWLIRALLVCRYNANALYKLYYYYIYKEFKLKNNH